jgi:hypothetical protein
VGGIDKILGELVDLSGNPVTSFLAKQAFAAIQRSRVEAGAEILRRKMASGKPWAFREDQVLALTFDYLRAAETGRARANLEMMADLVANGVADGGLTEDAVRHLMGIVADLSYEELRALSALIRATAAIGEAPDEPTDEFELGRARYIHAWRALEPDAEGASADLRATFGALQRTGLVVSGILVNGVIFLPTPKLEQLARLIDHGGVEL